MKQRYLKSLGRYACRKEIYAICNRFINLYPLPIDTKINTNEMDLFTYGYSGKYNDYLRMKFDWIREELKNGRQLYELKV